MKSNFRPLFGAFIFFAFIPFLAGQDANLPPEIMEPLSRTIREHDFVTLAITATDPEGDPLTYSWSIVSDPSGGNAFFRLIDGSPSPTVQGTPQAKLALTRGSNYPNPTYVGQSLQAKVDVSDGTNVSSYTFTVPIQAVNVAPDIIVDTRELGTPENPRLENEGFGVNARQSRDPDGGTVKFFWRIVGLTGGDPCAGRNALVLLGKETATPGFVVPQMSVGVANPARVNIEYIVEDGLHVLTQVFSGYLASPNPNCNVTTPPPGGNNPPVVSAAVSTTNARFGQIVTLTGNASDPGDTLTYSWVQLSTTGIPQVTISGSASRVATFQAPSTPGFYSFRFTATDSVGQSRSSTVTVQVSQNGGTDGGGGTSPPMGGTPSGTATGQTSCSGFASQGNNQPAVANVPASYTIVGGNRAEITASNGRDPDNTTVNVGGVNVSGAVTYLWNVVDGGGFLTNGALTGRQTATVQFNTPTSAQQRNATLSVTVNDGVACGTVYNVGVVVQPPTAVNNPPTASLQYQVQETGENGVNPGGTITVFPPVQILLSASGTDPDGDSLTYNWSVQPSLQGVTLGSGTSSRTLTAAQGTVGTVTVSVQVSDNNGGSVTRTVTFDFQPPQDKPVLAQAAAFRDGDPVSGPVPPGKVIVLSGADSEVVDGTAAENANLTFRWEQVGGPAAFVRNLESRDAQVIVEEIQSVSTLNFQVTARNGSAVGTANVSLTVDPALREETVAEGGDIFFARVGFGPAANLLFQTVAVIDNLSSEDAEDVRINFFDSEGMPLDAAYVDTDGGEPEIRDWDSETPILVPANSSRVLEFRAPEGAGLTVGWAVVSSSSRLRGSVRFQLIDETGGFLSDVGILSSPRGSRFQSAFRSRDGIAFAVTNPESEPIRFQVSLSDRLTGLRVEQNVNLPAGSHVAEFLDDFFPFLNNGGSPLIEEGTIELTIIGSGTMVPTLLITRDRLPVSAQSLARIE